MIADHIENNTVNVGKRLYVIHLVMRTLGCRLLDDDKTIVKKSDVFLRLFALSFIFYMIITGVMAMTDYIHDLRYLSEIASNVITGTESMYFLCHFYYREIKFKDLVHEIRREFWKNPLPVKFFKHFQTFDRISNGITLCLISVGFSALLFYYTVPLWFNNFNLYADIDAMRRTPFIAKYPYDQRVSPNFELTYLCQMLSSFFIVVSYIGLNSIYAVVCMHICAKIRLFQIKLNGIGAFMKSEEFSNIICEHQHIIRFANHVEDLYCPILLFHFLLSTVLICLNVVKITTISIRDNRLEVMLFSLYFAAVFLQIFVLCWMANEIFKESEKLATAVYSSEWYEASKHIRQDVLLILLRMRTPNVLTAGKFFPITLASFGSVCSTAGSYYTLLMSIE